MHLLSPPDRHTSTPPYSLRVHELVLPETDAREFTVAIRREEVMRLPFRQVHAVVKRWQELKEEGRRRGYDYLESQGYGELATLYFYRR